MDANETPKQPPQQSSSSADQPQLAPAASPAATPGAIQRRPGYIDAGYSPAAYYSQSQPDRDRDRDSEDGPDRGGLLEYWRILRRRKGTVLLISFAGLLLGVLVTLPQTPIYQARATLEIQDLNQDFMNLRQVSPLSESGPSYNALTDIQTQIKILQSESLAERVVTKLGAKNPPGNRPATRVSAWRKALNLADSPSQPLTPDEQGRQALRNLKVRAAGQTRIVEILYDSPDPQRAADFVNTLTNEFIDQNMEARWKMTQRTGDWLTRQLDDMRIKLERSEDALQAYARQAGLVFTNDKKENVSDEKLRQIQSELSKAQSERVQRQSRYEMAKNSPPDALPDVLGDTTLRDYQRRLTELRQKEAELTATYKPEYSKVKQVQAQIAPLEAAYNNERKSILTRIENDYNEALRREKLLSSDYVNQTRQVTSEAERSIQYNILKREVDTNRQLYEAMLQKVKESSIASAMRASNVRVVDAARAPRRPYKPQISLNGVLGLLAGVFIGVGFVVMQERADRTLQEPGDAQYFLGVPELGVIPANDASARRNLYYVGRRKAVSVTERAGARFEGDTERVELVTWQRKPSMVAEAFRVVLTSILFSGDSGTRPRVLVLTSASPREGKSTVTSNLSIAMAQVKQRTLLIDADLRKPRQHEIFGVPNDAGLSELLTGSISEREAIARVVHSTRVPGLFILPAGTASSIAANLLFSRNMPELLAHLRREFDMVLIDTPPMLQMPDARVLGKMADGVVLVARAGQTTRDAALAARHRFADDQTRVLGTILNDWDPKSSPGGYYGYYRGYDAHYSRYYGASNDV